MPDAMMTEGAAVARTAGLIGVASGWGAGHRETESGAPFLQAWGLADGLPAEWQALLRPAIAAADRPDLPRAEIDRLVADIVAELGATVAATVAAGRFPVVIGGDHSIAMGTWGGLVDALGLERRFGLIWFDAHMDAHTDATSPSQNPHGMPAAVLLGHGRPAFRAAARGVIRPQNLVQIGVRSFEDGEAALLARLGVRSIGIAEVRRRGLADVLDEAIALATDGTGGFGATIDLDGFDPADAPGVGLREPDGLRRGDMLAAVARLGARPDLRGLEIVEYIPGRDSADRRTARLVRDLLAAALGASSDES